MDTDNYKDLILDLERIIRIYLRRLEAPTFGHLRLKRLELRFRFLPFRLSLCPWL